MSVADPLRLVDVPAEFSLSSATAFSLSVRSPPRAVDGGCGVSVPVLMSLLPFPSPAGASYDEVRYSSSSSLSSSTSSSSASSSLCLLSLSLSSETSAPSEARRRRLRTCAFALAAAIATLDVSPANEARLAGFGLGATSAAAACCTCAVVRWPLAASSAEETPSGCGAALTAGARKASNSSKLPLLEMLDSLGGACGGRSPNSTMRPRLDLVLRVEFMAPIAPSAASIP